MILTVNRHGGAQALVWLFVDLTLAVCAAVPGRAAQGEPTHKGRTAAEWIEIMGGETGGAQGVDALAKIGAPAVPLLVQAVQQHPNEKTRRGAARALGEIGGPGVAAALGAVIRKEPGSEVGLSAASSLGKLIQRGDQQAAAERQGAISALSTSLAAPVPNGGFAALALAHLGPEGTAVLLASAGGKDAAARRSAMAGLARAKGEGIEEALVRGLGDADVEVRRESADAIAERAMDPSTTRKQDVAVPALLQALKDPDAVTRLGAVSALKAIGAGAREAIPALREATKDADPRVRKFATEAVGALEAIPSTAQARIPEGTADALEATHQGRKLDDWIKTFVSGSHDEKRKARTALTEAGPRAVPALRAAAITYPDGRQRQAVVLLLGSIGARGAAGALAEVMRTAPDGSLRSEAARELGELLARGDPEAEGALEKIIPELIESLAQDPTERGTPVECLAKIGPPAIRAVTKAVKGHKVASVRQGAVFCLKQSKDPQVAPTVIGALKDASPGVRLASARSIPWVVGNNSPHVAEAVSALTVAIKDTDVEVKKAAARTLGGMGPPARSALPALREAARTDPSLRYVAESAIRELE